MATFLGPMSQKLNMDVSFIKVASTNRNIIEVVSAYSKCDEIDQNFQCNQENKIYGEDFQCISSLFERKGRIEQCKGKIKIYCG